MASTKRVYNASNPSDCDAIVKWASARQGETISYEYARQGPNPQWRGYSGQVAMHDDQTVIQHEGDNTEFPAHGYLYRNITRLDKNAVVQSRAPTPPPHTVDDQIATMHDRIKTTEDLIREMARQVRQARELDEQNNAKQLQVLERKLTDARSRDEQTTATQFRTLEHKFTEVLTNSLARVTAHLDEVTTSQARGIEARLNAHFARLTPQPAPKRTEPQIPVDVDDADEAEDEHDAVPPAPGSKHPSIEGGQPAEYSPFQPETWQRYLRSEVGLELLDVKLRTDWEKVVRGPSAKTQIADLLQMVKAAAALENWLDSPLMPVLRTKIRRMRDTAAYQQGYDLTKVRKELAEVDNANDPYAQALAKVGRRPPRRPWPKKAGADKDDLPFRGAKGRCWACGDTGHMADTCPKRKTKRQGNGKGGKQDQKDSSDTD